MKALTLIVVVALVGGLVVGAAMTGMVNIPGLTPAKKKAGAEAQYASDKDPKTDKTAAKKDAKPEKAKPIAPPPKAAVKTLAPKTDPEIGYKKVAKLWNAMDAQKIKEQIGKGWKDAELARIFLKMDNDKVAEVLASLEPARATGLLKAIQAEASKAPAPGSGK